MTEPKQKPGRSKQDYQTPPEFLDAVREKFGPLMLDVAASHENAICPGHYTQEQDALTQSWAPLGGGFAWCNPPFSNIAPWVEKAYYQSHRGVSTLMLLPAGVGANWWRDWVHDKCRVHLLNGRIKFAGCKDFYPKDCVLLEYGPHVVRQYEVWSWAAPRQRRKIAS